MVFLLVSLCAQTHYTIVIVNDKRQKCVVKKEQCLTQRR